MNYGLLVETARDIREYVFGASPMPTIPYKEDGDWEPFLPKYEAQADNFETHGCTVWGAQNQIETFHKFLYGKEPNYSERFNYLLTPVLPGMGADPHNVYECIRKDGLIDHRYLPMTRTLSQFLDLDDLTKSKRARGIYWANQYDFRHEWLWDVWRTPPSNALKLLEDALKTSPVAISVTAWHRGYDERYIDLGRRNNHWCLLYRIDGKGFHVFDSYDHSKKILSHDHKIEMAKRIWLNRKTKSAMKTHISILTTIRNMFTNKKTLLQVCKDNLGKDASPADLAPDELGCAESVTTLLKQVFPETPIITGTWTLNEYLKDPKNRYKVVHDYLPETIIISPTGTGRAGTVGHVGIVDDDGLIMSSNSFGNLLGRFTQNHTPDTWRKRYAKVNKMPIILYRRVA